MIAIGISKWPIESANEIGKRSVEIKPIPEFIEMNGPYMYPDDNEGVTAISIFKYDKAKAKAGEAADAIVNGFMTFLGVPGFRYSIRLASGSSATMKMMALK
jgi:hypothetical protein